VSIILLADRDSYLTHVHKCFEDLQADMDTILKFLADMVVDADSLTYMFRGIHVSCMMECI